MNKVVLIGRLTKDPEIRYGGAGEDVCIADYTLAVDNHSRDEADFIRCRAIGKCGEFAERYLEKGMKIAVEGSITVDSWEDKDGDRRYMTYVFVRGHEFCEKKGDRDNGRDSDTGTRSKSRRSRK